MKWDTHCHLNFSQFEKNNKNILKKCREQQTNLIIVGVDQESSQKAIELAEKHSGVWAAIGVHPLYVEEVDFSSAFSVLARQAKSEKVVAIGEVGLDYHHFDLQDTPQNILQKIERQKRFFKKIIQLADKLRLPLIIHAWGSDKNMEKVMGRQSAYQDILSIFNRRIPQKKGVVHSFIGSYKTARQFTEKGFYLGLNGIITYSSGYDRLIREVGLENIVLETDAPYLTPAPLKRNQKNTPCNIKWVAKKISQVLQVKEESVYQKTTLNVQKIFQLLSDKVLPCQKYSNK